MVISVQKLKPKSLGKIKQKLITSHPLDISIANESKHEIFYECEEIPDGVRPKLLIKIKQLKKILKKKRR
jgi:hypothetical protein